MKKAKQPKNKIVLHTSKAEISLNAETPKRQPVVIITAQKPTNADL